MGHAKCVASLLLLLRFLAWVFADNCSLHQTIASQAVCLIRQIQLITSLLPLLQKCINYRNSGRSVFAVTFILTAAFQILGIQFILKFSQLGNIAGCDLKRDMALSSCHDFDSVVIKFMVTLNRYLHGTRCVLMSWELPISLINSQPFLEPEFSLLCPQNRSKHGVTD